MFPTQKEEQIMKLYQRVWRVEMVEQKYLWNPTVPLTSIKNGVSYNRLVGGILRAVNILKYPSGFC